VRGTEGVERKITMPYKRAESEVWYADFADASGARVRRSTETTCRREAQELEAKWRLEAKQHRLWGEQPSRTFDELMLKYLEAMEGSKRSWERDLVSTKHLKEAFSGRELGTLSRPDVREYVQKRKKQGVVAGTINREVGLLSAALNYARQEWDWEVPNPATKMRLRESDGRRRYAEGKQIDALFAAAQNHKRAPYLGDLLLVAVYTGCRRGELLGLKWSQVDLAAGSIRLAADETKSGKARIVPLNEPAIAAFRRRLMYRRSNCPASEWVFCRKCGERVRSVKSSWTAILEEVGMKDFRFHDLRHTCASWLVQNGVPLADVKDVLGHSTIRMTERYAHLAPENARAAVARLNVMTQIRHTSGITAPVVSVTT
jgi:integrase